MHSISHKLLAGALAIGMVVSAATSFAASNIGTGSVVGSGALASPVVWNDTFTSNSATGTINGIVIKARVLPVLNMVVTGSGIIDLGNLVSTAASSGSVNIEIGTNAVNGASVTARSTNGGLQNISSPTTYINNLVADEVADSYKYASALVAIKDSSFAAFVQTAALNTEVSNNTTNHILYSSNKPQQLSGPTDDFSFTVSAQPNAQTPAGDYKDVVVLTVTGNF
jgi:hypothetical protein